MREHTKKGNMRAHFYWIPLAVAATVMGQLVAAAQDWQTVDDFWVGSGNAEAHGVAVDAAGHIYVVGTANGHAIVRSSADGGTTWSTLDDFVYPPQTNSPNTNNLFNAITINQQGDLFVGGAGAAFVGGVNAGHWIVRRSTDRGATWETVDDYWRPMIGPDQRGTNGAVYSLSSDSEGRVYGAGLLLPSGPTYPHWWVRGSDTGGTNWNSKLVLFAGYGGVSQLTWAGEDVYVTGSVSDGLTTGLIVRSSDFGASWSTNFEGSNEFHSAIISDPAGNVYSAAARQTSSTNDWLVRRENAGGTNWTTLDQLSQSGNPNSIAVDAAGNICVAGNSADPHADTNGFHYTTFTWVSRQYSVASGQWNTTDVFPYSTNPTNMHAAAMGAALTPGGITFVVGYGTSDAGQRHWLVRKRAAVHPPQLQIAVANGSVNVSWPAAYTNYTLQWTDSTDASKLWQTFSGKAAVVNGQNTATFPLTPGPRLFRLNGTAGQSALATAKSP